MLITDYNKLTWPELCVLNRDFGTEFEINDGKIVWPDLEKYKKKGGIK